MPKQESFSKAFHANPAPMVVSDPVTGEFIDVNAQWVSLIGYSREEMIGHLSRDLHIWEDWTARERVYDDLLNHGQLNPVHPQFGIDDPAQGFTHDLFIQGCSSDLLLQQVATDDVYCRIFSQPARHQ